MVAYIIYTLYKYFADKSVGLFVSIGVVMGIDLTLYHLVGASHGVGFTLSAAVASVVLP